MSATNRRAGAKWETDLLRYLRNEGYDAERLRLTGAKDEGDLCLRLGGLPFILEAKNEKQINLASYVREAEVEARNYNNARGIGLPGANYAAVVKRRNHGVGEAYVVVPLHEWLRHVSHDHRNLYQPPF